MYKTLSFLIVFLLALSGLLCVYADTNGFAYYHIDSMGCTIPCPEEWTPYYDNITDEYMRKYKLTREDVQKELEICSMDFVGVPIYGQLIMMAYKYEAQLDLRLREQNDVFLNNFIGTFIYGTELNLGAKTTESEIVHTDNNVYIRYVVSSGTGNDLENIIFYFTTFDGFSYEFVFLCGNTIEPSDEKTISSIMEKIIWDFEDGSLQTVRNLNDIGHGQVSIQDEQEAEEIPNLNYYHYSENQINFLIPYGWKEKALSAERQTIIMKMVPIDDKTATSILFGCQDMWTLIPAELRKDWGIYSRKDIDSWLTADIIASMFDVAETDVQMVEHAGLQFGICTVKDTSLGVTLEYTYASTFKDGFYIHFQMHDPQGVYTDAFKTVLDSIYFD